MIVKELRADRWALVIGLLILLQRSVEVTTTSVPAQTLASLQSQTDGDFSLVAAGRLTAGAAYLWAVFFADTNLYLLVGLCGALFGAGLIASEVSSGSIYVLLSRPLSRRRALLTKYGVAAGLLLLLCALCGGLAVGLGAWQGVTPPSISGLLVSIMLLWLGTLFVMGLTLLYSVLVPNALAAGVLGFFTTYVLSIAPLFHTGAPEYPTYYLGGPAWSIATYFGSLGIYAGMDSPIKSLAVGFFAALMPPLLALLFFLRKAY
jgi:ABC-2 type transport system permease protein